MREQLVRGAGTLDLAVSRIADSAVRCSRMESAAQNDMSALDCWAQIVVTLERMADLTPCEVDAHVMRATASELAEQRLGRPGHLRAV